MQLLKEKILSEGIVLNDRLLKVDSFLNHQIDPDLMLEIGKEFARRFAEQKIDRILTIEASGIAVALATGFILHVPVVFAKKSASEIMNEEAYVAKVHSFTKKITSNVSVLRKFLPAGEKVLILDDFLAHGEAAVGLASLVEQAGSTVVGIGIVIEKQFQGGAEKINAKGYNLESLARIKAFENGRVILD